MAKEKMQSERRKRYHKDSTPSDDIITLINLVRQNPTLYNYKLQPNQRRRADILYGWGRIATQMGNKYTVEECRRKWKNLRDTYHQYRLRKPKVGDSLAKWRYAKDMGFLSTVYQPKMKVNRSNISLNMSAISLQVPEIKPDVEQVDNSIVNSGITTSYVNDETETFMLTSYEESVGDDVTTIDHTAHDHPNISHMELTHHHHHHHHHHHLDDDDDDDDGDDGEHIVKQEHNNFDDDIQTANVVDYEEVCLYEEADNSPTVHCETIIGGAGTVRRNSSTDTKTFQYIDANDFCISGIETTPSDLSTASVIGTTKIKNITIPTNAISCTGISTTTNALVDAVSGTYTITTPIVQIPIQASNHVTSSNVSAVTNGSIIQIQNQNPTNQVMTVSTSTSSTLQNQIQNQTQSQLQTQSQTRAEALIQHQCKSHSMIGQAVEQVPNQDKSNHVHTQTLSYTSDQFSLMRDELDLFFDFLKKKVQHFSKEEITSIQVEFLNVIVRRENLKKSLH